MDKRETIQKGGIRDRLKTLRVDIVSLEDEFKELQTVITNIQLISREEIGEALESKEISIRLKERNKKLSQHSEQLRRISDGIITRIKRDVGELETLSGQAGGERVPLARKTIKGTPDVIPEAQKIIQVNKQMIRVNILRRIPTTTDWSFVSGMVADYWLCFVEKKEEQPFLYIKASMNNELRGRYGMDYNWGLEYQSKGRQHFIALGPRGGTSVKVPYLDIAGGRFQIVAYPAPEDVKRENPVFGPSGNVAPYAVDNFFVPGEYY